MKRSSCLWIPQRGPPTTLQIWRDDKFALLPVDPLAPHVLAASLLQGWCVPNGMTHPAVGMLWVTGDRLTTQEIEDLLRQACAFVSETLRPAVFVVLSEHEPANWRRLLAAFAGTPPIEEIYSLAWAQRCAHGLYDKAPFGAPLIERVADQLLLGGEVRFGHREYCGHGLRFAENCFQLAEVHDGMFDTPLAAWSSREDFVRFFTPLSDYACSGADPAFAVFYAKSAWALGNQTISRERLLKIVKVRPASKVP